MSAPTYVLEDVRAYPLPDIVGRPEPKALDEPPAWVDYMEVRKIGDRWVARLVGSDQPQSWMRLTGTTARVATEGSGETPAEAIAEALTHKPH